MRGFPKHVILLVLVAVLKYVVKYWDGFPNTPDLGMEKARKGCMGLASRVTAGTCRGKPGKSLWLLQRWTWDCVLIFVVVAEGDHCVLGKQEREDGAVAGRPGARKGGGSPAEFCPGWHRFFCG